MTIIVNNYLIEETFQYKDETTNGQLMDGEEWYFIDMQKLLDNELLQAGQLSILQLNADEVELPDGKGICYSGMGVQFEYEGKKYDASAAANFSVLQEALKSGKARWYWNKDRFRKYGGTHSADLQVFIVGKEGEKIPDFQLSVSKNVN